jgi:hypothetical protein
MNRGAQNRLSREELLELLSQQAEAIRRQQGSGRRMSRDKDFMDQRGEHPALDPPSPTLETW